MNKILVVGPSWVGDMMMAHVLFQLLHQQHQGLQLDVFAPEWSVPLLERMPEVTNPIPSPFHHGQLKLGRRYKLAKKLRLQHYDQVIVLPNSLKSALLPFFANIPKRTGWLGEKRYGLLNDARHLDKAVLPQMVQRFAALAFTKNTVLPGVLPIPKLTVTKAQQMDALKEHQLSVSNNRPILALCPGAEFGASKQWPASYFAAVANEKLSHGWDVWIFGSKNDAAFAQQIAENTNNRCVNLAGKTQLSEAIDLLSQVSAVLTNDSGLMHISAALDRPVVALYGSTSPDFTPPMSENATILRAPVDLPCRPCFKRECPLVHHDCMKKLVPDQVLAVL